MRPSKPKKRRIVAEKATEDTAPRSQPVREFTSTGKAVVEGSSSEKHGKTEIVIPLQPTWSDREREAVEALQSGSDPSHSNTSNNATELRIEAPGGSETDPEKQALPMLLRNQLPGIQDLSDAKEKFQHDIKLRPDAMEATPDAYKIPIEEFGAALLRGMNWTPETGVGVGKNQRVVKPVLFESRPSGLGLGATSKPKELDKKNRGKPESVKNERWLGVRSLVKVTKGTYAGEYAVVLQVDGVPGLNNVLVQLSPGSDVIDKMLTSSGEGNVPRLPEAAIRKDSLEIVNPERLPSNHIGATLLKLSSAQRANDLSTTSTVPEESAKESVMDVIKSKQVSDRRSRRSKSPSGDRNRGRSRSGQRKRVRSRSRQRKRDNSRSGNQQRSRSRSGNQQVGKSKSDYQQLSRDPVHDSGNKGRKYDTKPHRNRDRSNDRRETSRRSKRRSNDSRRTSDDYKQKDPKSKCWVLPGIRVRIISKRVLDGSMYTKKGIVQVVTDPEKLKCMVAMESGAVIEVEQGQLETAIPKSGGKAMVVSGRHKGEIGTVLERKSRKEYLLLQLVSDMTVHKIPFDKVAEYCYDDDE